MKDKNNNRIEIGMNVKTRYDINSIDGFDEWGFPITGFCMPSGNYYIYAHLDPKFCEIIDLSGDWK